MDNDRYARLGAAAGIISVVLIVIGFGMFTSGAPGFDEPGDAWAGWFSDHDTRIQIGIMLISIATFFFLWFLGSLRNAIAAAEGGTGRLASIAFGGGAVSVALLLAGLSGSATAAFRPEVDPDLVRALNDFGAMVGGPAAASLTALFTATAIAGYRHGALPAPIAGFSALAALAQPLAFGVMFTTHGAFSAEGVLGVYVPVLTFGIAVLTASWTLYRGYTPGTATTT